MKYAFYCPTCKSLWQSESNSEITVENCHKCGNRPLYTGNTAEEWKALDKIAQDAACAGLESRVQSTPEPITHQRSGVSTWMRLIRFQGWLVFIVLIVAAIIFASQTVDEQPFIGFLIVSAAIVLGLFLLAFSMMFVDMAADLRAIRNSIPEKHD